MKSRAGYSFKRFSAKDTAKSGEKSGAKEVTLMGSGAILTEVVKAAQQRAEQGVNATVYSVTRWSEIARDSAACQQAALDGAKATKPFVARQLEASKGPVMAATDYVRAVPESIRAFLPGGRSYLTLGTDGFGRSDTRAALRNFFGVDAASIVKAALHVLQDNTAKT